MWLQVGFIVKLVFFSVFFGYRHSFVHLQNNTKTMFQVLHFVNLYTKVWLLWLFVAKLSCHFCKLRERLAFLSARAVNQKYYLYWEEDELDGEKVYNTMYVVYFCDILRLIIKHFVKDWVKRILLKCQQITLFTKYEGFSHNSLNCRYLGVCI